MNRISHQELLQQCNEESLRSASTFGAITTDTINWLLDKGELYKLNDGDRLFEQGSRGDSFYVILDGTMSYSKYHDGKYAFIREYLRGEQIGFMSMIALHDRVGRADAVSEVIVLEISSELFHTLHNQSPLDFGILMMNLAREMARTLRQVDNLLVEKT